MRNRIIFAAGILMFIVSIIMFSDYQAKCVRLEFENLSDSEIEIVKFHVLESNTEKEVVYLATSKVSPKVLLSKLHGFESVKMKHPVFDNLEYEFVIELNEGHALIVVSRTIQSEGDFCFLNVRSEKYPFSASVWYRLDNEEWVGWCEGLRH